MSDSVSDAKNDVSAGDGKPKRKDYERELARLHDRTATQPGADRRVGL